MDANGTRFQLLLGQNDWATCTDERRRLLREVWANPSDLAWNEVQEALSLKPRLFQYLTPSGDKPFDLSNRRGAGRDRYGNWYWIDESEQEILVNSAGTKRTSHFWAAGDGETCEKEPSRGEFKAVEPPPVPSPMQLRGLAVTELHYLVVGVLQPAPAGLLVFDLHSGGPPLRLKWPSAVPFRPFDMAPAPGGGVWVLDRENWQYWALDRNFNVIKPDRSPVTLEEEQKDYFQPASRRFERRYPARHFSVGISLDAASPVVGLNPLAIEALPDGDVLILTQAPGMSFPQIYRYRQGYPLGQPVSLEVIKDLIEKSQKNHFKLNGYDFAFLPQYRGPDSQTQPNDNKAGNPEAVKSVGSGSKISSLQLSNQNDLLFVAPADGNQAFAFHLTQEAGGQLKLEALPVYLPLRLFGGKGLVGAASEVYYDFRDVWLPLVEQPRPRYSDQAIVYTPSGDARPAFDGREPDCVWHRLMLDACIPPEAEVQIWSRAANDETELALTEWQPEPRLYLRGDGSELPYLPDQSGEGRGTWELLFQHAQGRYLQLKIRLSGNGRTTPLIQALRAYYPRFSYLVNYLPAVYREDSESASFLDRFLANIEGFYTTLEDKIAAVQMLFDFRSAPPETLEWLINWFGIALDPAWDEARRRLFIKHAMDFFQYRGTVRGLLMALRLVLDDCLDEALFTEAEDDRVISIRIVEQFLTRRTPGAILGDPTEASGPRLVPDTVRWLPAQGGANLNQRYRDALKTGSAETYPVRDPQNEKSVAWRQFSLDVLGFVPAATGVAAEQRLWQNFLARRYQRFGALKETYRLTEVYKAFEELPLPAVLPADGAPLQDWYQFESVVLSMRRTAHRFRVLLPLPTRTRTALDDQQRRLSLADRLIRLEKPAHTVFDVKFYWAMFRVGEARLGKDSLIDLGGRAPDLMLPVILNQAYLAESYLAPRHPQDVIERQILGRDRLDP